MISHRIHVCMVCLPIYVWLIFMVNHSYPNTTSSNYPSINPEEKQQKEQHSRKTQKNNGWLCWVQKKVQNHCWNLRDVAECIALLRAWLIFEEGFVLLICQGILATGRNNTGNPNEVNKKQALFESNMVGLANRQRISLSRSSCLVGNSMTNFQRSNLWSLVLHKLLQNFKPLSWIYGYKNDKANYQI